MIEGRLFATNHQTVSHLQAPDAATCASVHELEAFSGQIFAAPDRIVKIRVAAINDDISFGEQRCNFVNHVIGGLPRWHHGPDDAWSLQFLYQLLDTIGAFRPL